MSSESQTKKGDEVARLTLSSWQDVSSLSAMLTRRREVATATAHWWINLQEKESNTLE
jgi:hypothetical protein